MAWVVLTVIAGVVFAGGLIAIIGASTGEGRFWGAGAMGLSAIFVVVSSVAFSIHRVGQREVGVVHSFTGAITGATASGKLVWTAPWASVSKENIGIQREDFSLGPNTSGGSAVSHDVQAIFADLSLNYEVEARDVVGLYKSVGPNWKAILLDSRVLQDFKEVTSQYTAAEITTKREQLRQDTKRRLAVELQPYSIKVVDFFVKNLDYTDTYKAAVTAKNVQVQDAFRAQAKVAQSKAEANQNVAIAEGQARSTLLKASAEATALSKKGEAIRRNPEVLQLEAIDKLNPNTTVIYCTGTGSGNCPSVVPAAAAAPSGGAGG